MSRKAVGLDSGHSLLTKGKRTMKFEDGTFMHEWEFNNSVCMKLYEKLLNSDIDVFITSTYKFRDMPLQERTDIANREIVKYGKENCLLLSLHANAYGDEWNDANGMSTFSYTGNAEDYKVNKLFNKNLSEMMKLKYGINNRGAKEANFHMLRETNCPAVLIEHAFMTNKREAKLLLDDDFRNDCATVLYDTILEYFNIKQKGKVEYEYYRSRFGFQAHYLWGDIKDFGIKILNNSYGQGNRTIEEETCTNGTFFGYQANGIYYSTSILYDNGIIYKDVSNHFSEQGKPQSCLIIYKNNQIEMKRIYNLNELNLDNIRTIIGGLGLINKMDKNFTYSPSAEGFCKCWVNNKYKNYEDVLRTTAKTVIGWRKEEPTKLYLITFPKAHHNRVLRFLKAKSFPFDIALSVDGGGSTFMNDEKSMVLKGNGRKIHNIIGFNLD